MARRYRSRISASVHKAMSDLNKIGLVDQKTMRRFDASCLTKARKRPKSTAVVLRGQPRPSPGRRV
jgi:putative transcriptional regulator